MPHEESALTAAEAAEVLAAQRRPPLEPPAWPVERGIGTGRPAVRLHAGSC